MFDDCSDILTIVNPLKSMFKGSVILNSIFGIQPVVVEVILNDFWLYVKTE
jgi:hypothetical protein